MRAAKRRRLRGAPAASLRWRRADDGRRRREPPPRQPCSRRRRSGPRVGQGVGRWQRQGHVDQPLEIVVLRSEPLGRLIRNAKCPASAAIRQAAAVAVRGPTAAGAAGGRVAATGRVRPPGPASERRAGKQFRRGGGRRRRPVNSGGEHGRVNGMPARAGVRDLVSGRFGRRGGAAGSVGSSSATAQAPGVPLRPGIRRRRASTTGSPPRETARAVR